MTQTKIWQQAREEARNLGLKTYEGRPCIHGHGTERLVSNGFCLECNRIYAKKFRENHKEKTLKESRERYSRKKNRLKKEYKEEMYKKFQEFENLRLEYFKNEKLKPGEANLKNLDGYPEFELGGVSIRAPKNSNIFTDKDKESQDLAKEQEKVFYESEFGCIVCGSYHRYSKNGSCVACRKAFQRKDYQENRGEYIQKVMEYQKKRRKEDPIYNFKQTVRNFINSSLKRSCTFKDKTNEEILGCTHEEFRKYIESLFQEGMSFENRSSWHIDHIKPLATATTEEEVLALCHYTNLQPLWKGENLSKGSTWEE